MMIYSIRAESPEKMAELRQHFAAQDKARRAEIRKARKASGGARFVVIDAGFPAIRYLVWDCERDDNLRGAELNAKNPPRHPWFAHFTTAQKIADRLNAAL